MNKDNQKRGIYNGIERHYPTYVREKATDRGLITVYSRLKIMVLVLSVVSMMVTYDLIDGKLGWILDYGIPFLLTGSISTIIIMVYGYRRKWEDYIIYQLCIIVIAIVMNVLFLLNVSSVLWPSMTTLISGIVIFGIISIVYRKNYVMELRKCFHI